MDKVGKVTYECLAVRVMFSFLAIALFEMQKQNIMIFVITISGISCRQI